MMPSLRTLAASVGGYLVFALSAVALFQLTGRDPHAPQSHWFEAATIVYGMFFAALGGFVAGRAEARRPLRAVSGVAMLLALGALVSLVASPAPGATWSQWAALIVMTPSVFLGAFRKRVSVT